MKKVVLLTILFSFLSPFFSEEIVNVKEENDILTGFQENSINAIEADSFKQIEQNVETDNTQEKENNFFKPTIGNHFTAFGEAMASNLFLLGVNRFIRKAPYAYISWDSMYKNLTNPWVWDQDEFSVNHIGHPYQGSYYYIAGRSNNLPFWESALVAVTGSVTWELFAETETPSYNDLIVTTIGGISLGEMLHRLYFDAADLNKLLGFAVSPFSSINNAIWSGKLNRPSDRVTSFNTKLFFGVIADEIFFKQTAIENKDIIPFYLGGGVNIIYGNPYGLETIIPYSHFNLDVKFSGGKNYYNLSIFSDGMLLSFAPWEQDRLKTTLGLSLHYDFLVSTGTNYSANSLGFTIKQNAILPKDWDIKWDLHLNYIMMSASDFYYLFNEIIDPGTNLENRSYDLGFGTGLKTNFSVSHPKVGSLHLFYFLDWVKTIDSSIPAGGSHGSSLIGVGSVAYEHKVYKSFSIGIDYSSYIKSAFYTDIESTYEHNQYISIYFKNQFK